MPKILLRPDRVLALSAVLLSALCVLGLMLDGNPWWLLLLAQPAVVACVLPLLRRTLRERDQAQAIVALLQQAAPVLSRASFESTRVAEKARIAAGDTSGVAQHVGGAADSARTASAALEAAAAAAEETGTAANNCSGSLTLISRDVCDMAASSRLTSDKVGQLAQAVRTVEEAAKAIEDVAFRTRLLALNATIEAARAGEAGRGFGVVAREVRDLADSASAQAKTISAQVKDILHLNKQAVDAVGQTTQTSEATAQRIQATVSVVTEAIGGVAEVSTKLEQALGASERAVTQASQLAGEAQSLATAIGGLGELSAASAHDVSHSLEALLSGMAAQGVEGVHTRIKTLAQGLTQQAGKVLERAVKDGRVTEEALFQPTYVDIAGTNPPKKSVGWDRLTDELFPALQEPLLEQGAAYAIVVNNDGYCPTHNRKFSQALTGDAARDLANNRTKRIFSDTVGQRCAKHEGVLVQTYLRDTGETMHDLSLPVFVKGRKWGAVRVGYVAAQVPSQSQAIPA